MYQAAKKTQAEKRPDKPKKEGAKKFNRFIREMFEGRHLVRSWKSLVAWVALFVVVILLCVFNERKIEQEEQRVLELQKEEETVMHDLKSMNEVLYTEEEEALREQAAEQGFEAANANEFYRISTPKAEMADEEE